mmetsp:Transcript_31032/g.65676  ORF Transcript_31032/g.65676 Transcript_31032/m.65676 type:complete len:81 (+) Transcript_31032:159-401(+)
MFAPAEARSAFRVNSTAREALPSNGGRLGKGAALVDEEVEEEEEGLEQDVSWKEEDDVSPNKFWGHVPFAPLPLVAASLS